MSESRITKNLTSERVENGYHVYCRQKTGHMLTYVFNTYGDLEKFAKTYFMIEDWSKKENDKKTV